MSTGGLGPHRYEVDRYARELQDTGCNCTQEITAITGVAVGTHDNQVGPIQLCFV